MQTDPRPTILGLATRYLDIHLNSSVPARDFIEEVHVLFDSSPDLGRTVVADIVFADDDYPSRMLVQWGASGDVIFASYRNDDEVQTIPPFLYVPISSTAWMDHVDDGDMADPFDPEGLDR